MVSAVDGGRSGDRGASRGHTPIVPPRIGPTPDPLGDDVLAVFRAAPVTAISDCVGRLYTMDPGIRPLYAPMRRLVGVAVTVKAPPGDNWAVYGGLNRAFPGSVLVVDWRGHTASCGGGEKALLPAIANGLAGLVIDGAWRDLDDLAAADFPICGRGRAAFSPGKNELGEVNVPVACGGVVVEAGDVVVADAEGAVVVPRAHVDAVAAKLSEPESARSAVDERIVQRLGESFDAAVTAAAGVVA